MDDTQLEQLTQEVAVEEGFRSEPYRDTRGYATIGYGFLVDPDRGGWLPKEAANAWLRCWLDRLDRDMSERFPWVCGLDPVRRRGLMNMAYQLGVPALSYFTKMLDALRNDDWDRAYREALNSRWAQQTPERAHRVARMLRDGPLYEG